MKINPDEDGVKHINIYSNAKTELGRALSNFTYTPFIHPEFGDFESMEGFYFYISTGFINEDLRKGYGWRLKKHASQYPRVALDNFLDIVDSGLRAKVRCNGNIMQMLKESTLPLMHYYWWKEEGKPIKINYPVKHQWIVTSFTEIREELKQGVFR